MIISEGDSVNSLIGSTNGELLISSVFYSMYFFLIVFYFLIIEK